MWTYCSLFICPLKRHSDCFHFRSVMNKMAINIVCRFLCGHEFSTYWVKIFQQLDKYLGVQLLNYIVRLCVTHCVIQKLSSVFQRDWAVLHPPAMRGSSSCFRSSSAFGAVRVSHLSLAVGVLLFYFQFPNSYDVEDFCRCLLDIFISSLVRRLFRSVAHVKMVICFLTVES